MQATDPRLAALMRHEGRAVFAQSLALNEQTLACHWEPDTLAAYERLDDAWETVRAALTDQPAALVHATALYEAAQAFIVCREREGFVDGYLCGRQAI